MNVPPNVRLVERYDSTRDRLSPTEAAALAHILRSGSTTFRATAQAAGCTSSNSGWRLAHNLRRRGLVDWEHGRSGTLHAVVAPVPVG